MQITTDTSPMVNDGLQPVTALSVREAKDDARQQLREAAVAIAATKGHTLGTWRDRGFEDEVAYCRGCRAYAVIDLIREPRFAGPAVSRPCVRPDAFLANQHESLTRANVREIAADLEGAAGRLFPSLDRLAKGDK